MSELHKPLIVLNQTSGEGEPFDGLDGLLKYRLVISGTAGANIKAFINNQIPDAKAFYIAVQCSNWNGAVVTLQGKVPHEDHTFQNTDDIWIKDDIKVYHYK